MTTKGPVIIGIVGGIASGKTMVADELHRLGAVVLDADRLGHEVLREADVRTAVRRRWGEAVMGADGEIDRAAVARRVFGPAPEAAEELEFLETLTHPRIGRRLRQQIDDYACRAVPALVLDAPVLLKAGWHAMCNTILFVDAPRAQRLQRALARGWTRADFAAREAAQESLDTKRTCADWVIDNGHSRQHTAAQIERFWHSLDDQLASSAP